MRSSSQIILYAEDNDSDAFLVSHAFKKAEISQHLVIVPNGRAAIDYLKGAGEYADRKAHPLPCLTLLDLNMPGMSGLEVLKWAKSTPSTRHLIIVMLTSSNQESDIRHAYEEGANGYLVKPGGIQDIVKMARAIKDYWLTQNRHI